MLITIRNHPNVLWKSVVIHVEHERRHGAMRGEIGMFCLASQVCHYPEPTRLGVQWNVCIRMREHVMSRLNNDSFNGYSVVPIM